MAIGDFYRRVYQSIERAPRLIAVADPLESLPTITVIVPAYNEAVNIEACLSAIAANQSPALSTQIIVADDESTDETFALASQIADKDENIHVFTVPPRPSDELWRGKNWACYQAVQKATGEYVLFVDADVRLEPEAIARALTEAKNHASDLLSCAPALKCDCFSEWLVQPIMASLLAVGFDFERVNDPSKPEEALAAGPFMLFRRTAYDRIGGHQAVAANPVEDLALAALIKSKGLSLRYVLGIDVASLRMYQNFSGLWEGWTKNYHIGGGRNALLTLVSAAAVFLIFSIPQIALISAVVGLLLGANATSPAVLFTVALLASTVVALQWYLRTASAKLMERSTKYLWLSWLGGAMVSAIAIVSLIKTETGWGWTWRGRSLAE